MSSLPTFLEYDRCIKRQMKDAYQQGMKRGQTEQPSSSPLRLLVKVLHICQQQLCRIGNIPYNVIATNWRIPFSLAYPFFTGSLAKQRIRTSNSILIMDISVTAYMPPPVVAPSYQETVHAKRKCGTQESSTPFIQPYLATTKEQCPFELYLQSTRKYIYQFLVQGHQRFMPLEKLRLVLLFVVSMVSGKLHTSMD